MLYSTWWKSSFTVHCVDPHY